MTQEKRTRYAELLAPFNGDAIEMEGAALAHVCTHNQIPFLLLRTISDKANEAASVDFARFLKNASKQSFEFLQKLLREIS